MSEKNKTPSDEADKFMLRLQPGMRDQIREAAKTAGRSMNAEINYRLDRAYMKPAPTPGRIDPLPKLPEYDEALRAELEEKLQMAGDRELLETDPGKAIWAGRMALNLLDKQEQHLRWIVRGCNTYYSRLSQYRSRATSPFINYHWKDSPRSRNDE